MKSTPTAHTTSTAAPAFSAMAAMSNDRKLVNAIRPLDRSWTAPDSCGTRVVIVDDLGDYTALGLAELLSRDGRSVALVTAFPQVGVRVMPLATADYPWIYPRLVESGVTMRTQTFVVPMSIATRTVWSATDDLDSRSLPVPHLRPRAVRGSAGV